MLRHRRLGESIASWEDGHVVEIPPEHITDRWEYIPGLPGELNPPFDAPAPQLARNGHAHPDRFLRGLLVGSVLGAGLAAVVALLLPRD